MRLHSNTGAVSHPYGIMGTMTTLIESPRSTDAYGSDDEITPEGEAEIARLLEEQMAQRFGGRWQAVPGGEAVGEWNRLSAGNSFALPTEEQVEVARRFVEHLLEDPRYWAPPKRWLALDTVVEPGAVAVIDDQDRAVEDLGRVAYAADAEAPATQTLAAALDLATEAGWVRADEAQWDGSLEPCTYVLAVRRK